LVLNVGVVDGDGGAVGLVAVDEQAANAEPDDKQIIFFV
jgi:hypothetical protein